MTAGKLDRRGQFRRFTETDDGYGVVQSWADHGAPQWMGKKDVSDGEKFRAQEMSASITTRFVVRWSGFTTDLTPKDRLFCEGLEYSISGIKEIGKRRTYLEITAAARVDLAQISHNVVHLYDNLVAGTYNVIF
jgi:SPP1 family predicted phage head-tail adaptor